MISQQVNNVPTRNGLQSSPATSNAIRGAEQSGNIANQRFARTWWVRGLTWQFGRLESKWQASQHWHSKRASIQQSKDSSDFEGMIILPAKLSKLTGSSKANSTGSSLANSPPGSTQTRQTSNKDTINHVQTQTTQCKDDMLYGMRCGMQNARYDRKCMNLASTWKYKCATVKMR